MSDPTLLLTPESQRLIVRVIGSITVTATLVIFFWYPLKNLMAFLQPRQPGETWAEFFRRVQTEFSQEQERRWTAKRERKATLYGSRRKTWAVNLVNLGLLIGSLYLSAHIPPLFFWIVGYIAMGWVVNSWLGVVRFEGLPPLKRSERQTLHLFYAWFWPLYVWAWRNARQQRG